MLDQFRHDGRREPIAGCCQRPLVSARALGEQELDSWEVGSGERLRQWQCTSRGGLVDADALVHQESDYIDIRSANRQIEGAGAVAVASLEVGSFLQQETQQRHGSGIVGCDQERRAAEVGGSGVDVGSARHQQADFLEIGNGPDQRRCTGCVGRVHIGAGIEQNLHGIGIAEKSGEHQRRDAIGIGCFGTGSLSEFALYRRGIVSPDRVEQSIGRQQSACGCR